MEGTGMQIRCNDVNADAIYSMRCHALAYARCTHNMLCTDAAVSALGQAKSRNMVQFTAQPAEIELNDHGECVTGSKRSRFCTLRWSESPCSTPAGLLL